MADKNKEAMTELLDGISYIVDKKINNTVTQILTGVITDKTGYDGTYTYSVKINNNIYNDIPTITDELYINNIVKLVVPQGQYGQMFIMGYIH